MTTIINIDAPAPWDRTGLSLNIPRFFSESVTKVGGITGSNRRQRNIETIESFRALIKGWNGYDADPIDSAVLDRALRFIRTQANIYQPMIFPTACNSVQFEYSRPDGRHLEVEMGLSAIDLYYHSEDGTCVEKTDASLDDAMEFVDRFYAE